MPVWVASVRESREGLLLAAQASEYGGAQPVDRMACDEIPDTAFPPNILPNHGGLQTNQDLSPAPCLP